MTVFKPLNYNGIETARNTGETFCPVHRESWGTTIGSALGVSCDTHPQSNSASATAILIGLGCSLIAMVPSWAH